MGSYICADMFVDSGGQSQVEQSVGVGSPRKRQQMRVELGERAVIVIPAAQVGVPAEEG